MIKSCFFWETPKHGNTVPEVVRNVKRLEVDRIEIKAADGAVAFGYYTWGAWRGKPNLTPELMRVLRAQGIQVYGWGYNYGKYPELEGDIAAMQCITLDLDGWIFDVELEMFQLADAEKRMRRMLKTFRGLAAAWPAGFSSFPCWYNPDVPQNIWWKKGVYEAAAEYCDFWEPQAYWGEKWKTTAAQLPVDAILQHREIKDMPVIVAGRGWNDGAGKVTPDLIDKFVDACRTHNAAGTSWWRSDLILGDPLITEAIARIQS